LLILEDMVVIYDLIIRLYYLAILLAFPFNSKARDWVRGRSDWEQELRKKIQPGDHVIWFHASSLGEFEQGRPVIESWRKEKPSHKILLTFFSPSGYNHINKSYEGVDYVHYIPFDTRRNARSFIDIVKPELVVFVKYEFWYHLLSEAKKIGSKIILVSAIFRAKQLFFKFYGKWYRKLLYLFDHIFVQDEISVDLLMQLGGLSVSISGDTRFDRVVQIAEKESKIDIAREFSENRFTYVFGSTWSKDEDIIIPYINDSKSDSCFILAPHEISEAHIKNLINRLHKRVALFSLAYGKSLSEAKVLIIDNIGMLSKLYRYGKVAYVGGGFRKGIHNILEPAVYGMPVVFGPRYHKFREAVQLIREGGAFSVSNYDELKNILDKLREEKSVLDVASGATRKFVQSNLGATQAIIEYLKKM